MAVNEMNTVQDYHDAEASFYDGVRNSLGDNLGLYVVTGSVACGNQIPGWSDIDVLLVVKRYEEATLSDIGHHAIIGADVKIGWTVFDTNEFGRSEHIDTKTLISCQRMQAGLYQPRIIDGIEIPTVSDSYIYMREEQRLPEYAHGMKRLIDVLTRPDHTHEDVRKAYKQYIAMLKILLRQYNGGDPMTYEETARSGTELLTGSTDGYFTPLDIMAGRISVTEQAATYFSLVRHIAEGPKRSARTWEKAGTV